MSASPHITPQQADELIRSRTPCLSVESLPLAQCAGRILREAVYSERDQPPFDRVAMDGIAIRSEMLGRGLTQFRIQATQAAGDPAMRLADEAQAIEVMTGAILPSGCDCVIQFEQVQVADGVASVHVRAPVAPYLNVHRRGSDAVRGQLLLDAGTCMDAPEVAVAASAGMAQLSVSRQPGIMVISTGSELIEPGAPIADFQIRRSNVFAMSAALRRRGFDQVRDDHAVDEEAELLRKLSLHLESREVVLLSGGVSMGKFDLVPKILRRLGVAEVFHKVAQRPGMPLWFGVAPRGQIIFGLPGNPVATLVCLIRYVVPALDALMGARPARQEKLPLSSQVKARPSVLSFLPVVIGEDADGRACANPSPTNGSGDFVGLAGTQGFVELPPGAASYPAGYVAHFHRW